MMLFSRIACISVDNTRRRQCRSLTEQRLLSLPVVDGREFRRVLSKQYMFEEYFKNFNGTKEEFVAKRVEEFMKTKIDTIGEQ